jgi:ABC-type nickel/cobalt efflux system permease component RcnA
MHEITLAIELISSFILILVGLYACVRVVAAAWFRSRKEAICNAVREQIELERAAMKEGPKP